MPGEISRSYEGPGICVCGHFKDVHYDHATHQMGACGQGVLGCNCKQYLEDAEETDHDPEDAALQALHNEADDILDEALRRGISPEVVIEEREKEGR